MEAAGRVMARGYTSGGSEMVASRRSGSRPGRAEWLAECPSYRTPGKEVGDRVVIQRGRAVRANGVALTPLTVRAACGTEARPP
jgi:hypothetical protein